MKLNSAVYTHRTNDNESGIYYNTSYFLKKIPPHCLNIDLYPPPPDNDRVCDHNALLAFPQEKISHYTTACIVAHLYCCSLVLLLTCIVAHLYCCSLVLLLTCIVAHLYCCSPVLLLTGTEV